MLFLFLCVIKTIILGAIKLKKKVVFVDKPLPLTHPTKVNLSKICHKLLLRSNLCGFEAFTFSGLDLPSEKASSSENENKEQTCDTANNSQGSFYCSYNFILFQRDFLGKKLYHNAFYRLWRLSNKLPDQSVLMKSNTDVKTVTLLVRTKLDGCEVILYDKQRKFDTEICKIYRAPKTGSCSP